MTNKEWLVNLSTEELLNKVVIACETIYGTTHCPNINGIDCYTCQLNWLEAEYKEEE